MGKFVSDFLKGNLFKGDKGVWMIYFFLCLISLVEVYSASSSLTYKSGNHWAPMINQAGFLLAGFIIILFVHRIPCKWFMIFPFVLLPVSIFLLLFTLVYGGDINSASRWMRIGSIQFQPSEIAKVSLIMSVAVVLAKTQAEEKIMVKGKQKIIVGAIKGKRTNAFKIIGIMTVIVCGLIFTENFSTAAILFIVVVTMMFIGNVPTDLMAKGLLTILAIGVVAGAVLLTFDESTLKSIPGCTRFATWKNRITNKAEHLQQGDTLDIKKYINDENSQVTHSFIAVANSNILGKGPGNSVERDFLSHAESDFIYSIIVEETGIAGAIFVIFLYLTLLVRVGRIAQKSHKFFPAYLIIGLGLMMVLQAIINMGVAVGLFPVTGQPLPLISRGGTSILLTSFYIGMILSVSRYTEKINETKQEPAELAAPNETTEYYSEKAMV